MRRNRSFITSCGTTVFLIFHIRLHYCTWFYLKILLQKSIFSLSEADSNIETSLNCKLHYHSLSTLKSLLCHPINCGICFFTFFSFSVQQDSLWIFQWQNILSLICNWISKFYDKWSFTEISEIQLKLKIVLSWHNAIWKREIKTVNDQFLAMLTYEGKQYW